MQVESCWTQPEHPMYELEVVSRDLPGEADPTPTTWFGDSRCFSQKRCSDGAVMWRRRCSAMMLPMERQMVPDLFMLHLRPFGTLKFCC